MKILMIEDNDDDVILIREMLAMAGPATFEVTCAECLSTALARLGMDKTDAVLLDLGLPDSRGLDTFHEVRRRTPGIPIIILSGLDDEDMALKAVQGGAQDYLIKGQIDSRTLRRSLRYAFERCQAEAAARESEEKYRVLVETTNTGFVILDAEGRVLDANPEYVRLTGHDRADEILGRRVTEWTAQHDRERYVREIGRCLEEGSVRNLEVDYVGRDGHFTPVEINETSVGAARGTHIVALCRDITERVESQRALADYQQRLRSMALELVLGEERERRRIAAGLHDEIGQTLALVCMRMEMLAERVPSTDLRDQCRDMLDAVRSTLDSTRSLTFELTSPALHELGFIPAVRELAREFQKCHGITFRVTSDPEFEPMSEDLVAFLFRSVRELMINVVRHSKAANCRLVFRREARRLLLVVHDDGIGFDAGSLPPRKAAGRGFGLSSIRERLKALGGGFETGCAASDGGLVRLWVPVEEGGAANKQSAR